MKDMIRNQERDIAHLAAFLNVELPHADELSTIQQAYLLKQLVAISQIKLARLALRLDVLGFIGPCRSELYPECFQEHIPHVG